MKLLIWNIVQIAGRNWSGNIMRVIEDVSGLEAAIRRNILNEADLRDASDNTTTKFTHVGEIDAYYKVLRLIDNFAKYKEQTWN